MAIAFFDLDRTVLDVNSASLWVKRQLRERRIGPMQALYAGLWVGLYNAGFVRMEGVLEAAFASLRGARQDDLVERTRIFWNEELRGRVRPGAPAALDRHRERGDRRVLLTSSSPYLSELLAEALSLDDFLCNRFEVEDGLLTGRAVRPFCFGDGKVEHATAYATRHGERLTSCAFYSDSYSDLPMLAAVGHPVAVNPDVRLRRTARARGWPVEDWGEARAAAERAVRAGR
jgi:HAD superfamily hydrolase (TIGR01490 family)